MALNQHHNRYRSGELDDEAEEDWLISYADMVTLLMCFFLAMASISKVDMGLFEAMRKGLRSDIGKQKEVKTPLAEIQHDLDSLLREEKKAGNVSVSKDPDGIVLEFSSSAFYELGKAEFSPEAGAILEKVTSAIKGIDYYKFRIEQGIGSERLKAAGYADTKPKVPNVDSLGTSIPDNQARNRRIVVRIH